MSKKANPNFIGTYNRALTKDECNSIIEYFENCEDKYPGHIVNYLTDERYIDKNVKDSTDLTINFSFGDPSSKILGDVLVNYIKLYRQEYPCCDYVSTWNLSPTYNIQRYTPNQGYHNVHCESGGLNSPRFLAWMIYLNTVTDGGETRFPAYKLNVKAEVGKLLIWPAFFTHIHHGIVSRTQTKYIATGWFDYQE